MQLIAPLFLLGLALLALPFWLHRLKTETPDRKAFASSMFLSPSEDPIHIRRKLRYLFLMCLRLLFLLLLVLAFSRPFWPLNETPSTIERTALQIIVVDTSASMAGKGKLSEARSRLADIVRGLETNEAAQLFSIDQKLQKLSEVTTDSSQLMVAFDDIRVSKQSLSYDSVARALESLMSADDSADRHYKLHFISDFQQSAMPSRFADLVPEPTSAVSYDLTTHSIVGDSGSSINLAIDHVEVNGQDARISVRSYASSETVQQNQPAQVTAFELRARVDGSDWLTANAEITESSRITVSIDGFAFEPTQNTLEVQLLLDDVLTADNSFYFIENRSAPEPLLLLTDNPYGAEALYVNALFADQVSAGSSRNYVAKPEVISSFDARTLDRYSWVLIDDIGSIGSALAEDLTAYLNNGGSIFAASGDKALSLQRLPMLSLAVTQSNANADLDQLASNKRSFSSISSVDQSHPVLNKLVGWNDLRFEKWLPISITDQTDILVQLDEGDPLLIEQQIGRGKLMLLSSSLNNQWNNLPVSPLFVAMMRSVAEYLSGAELIESEATVGDTLNIQGNDIGAGQLIDPDGNAVLALGGRLQSDRLSMNKIGFYQASTASGEYLIGVNMHPNESELTSVPEQSLIEWQALATRNLDSSGLSSSVEEIEERHYTNLWFWLLALAAIAVLMESLLANFKLSGSTRVIQTAKAMPSKANSVKEVNA